ncbi:hypothetical protein MTsPCn9_07460 [Croceitalea sp. MTPC9]|uniref:hypothetical protein n=1 Tax=unclassified Croceitalea TaxID=2632280 RepID=UPI002B3E45AA|nr:hypothetical protein MTsPCn6_01250 [Croceitalea sp. MTPC6]GMN15810.1 hypothetical protein MTsPCn9_07460 [Croceitalea sp. MTPC9]
MKNKLFYTTCFAILAMFFFSCSNDGGPAGPGTGPTSWNLENFNYQGGASATSSTTVTYDETEVEISVLVVTTANDDGKGAFNGSVITVTYPNFGGGLYSLTSREAQAEQLTENPNAQVAVLECIVGTATTDGTTTYLPPLSGSSVEVSIDSDGKYHFDISSAIQLQKGLEVNGGVANAPQIASFTVNNAFDFSN